MSHDDVLFGYRLRLFTLAEELGNVSEACRQMGVARSTYYAWKPKLERYGLDGLRVRERRRPRMPNQIGPHLEHRILAFSLGHPGFGPRRISAELRRPKWGGIRVSEHGVWRVLKRFNLNTRSKRFALIARHAEPYDERPEREPTELHIDASEPGEKVQMDCFYVGRLSGSKGVVWQCTAIDVASAYVWAFLRSTHRNPSARHTAELCHLVASELKAAGWKLAEVTTDNGSEFRSADFGDAVAAEKATQRRIKAGRPNSNGCAERAQLTILEECWRPAFSRSLAPKITALRRDLDEYLRYYNNDRAHTGRLTKGRVPADIVFKARKMGTVR
ncbi:MAG: DDE-type integrase/transposase/recombinase [Solirubrobacterales bacterium]